MASWCRGKASAPDAARDDAKTPELMTPEREAFFATLPRREGPLARGTSPDVFAKIESLISGPDHNAQVRHPLKSRSRLDINGETVLTVKDVGGWGLKYAEYLINKRADVIRSITDKSPVSAAAVDAYGIKLPEGWVRDGDRHVFNGSLESTTGSPKSTVDSSAWKMTEDEYVRAQIDATDYWKDVDSEGKQLQEDMWREQYLSDVMKAPRDADIPAAVLAAIPEAQRNHVIKFNEKARQNWADANASWSMTYRQFLAEINREGRVTQTGRVRELHRSAVRQALAAGKPVPDSVMMDYPELRIAPPPDVSAMTLPDLKAQARAEGVEPTGSAAAIRERISGKRRLLNVLDSAEQAARDDLAQLQRPGTLGINKPLGMAVDYTIIGAAKLARGAVKFADWSAQMLAEFGEGIRPHLRTVWDNAHAALKSGVTTKEEARKWAEQRSVKLARAIEKAGFSETAFTSSDRTEAPAAQPTAQAPAARTGFVPAAQRGAQPAETVTPVQKLPAEDLIPTQPRRLRIWLREHFLPSRGVGSELYDKYVDMHAAVAAGQIESKQNVRRVNRLIDVATKTSGRTNDDIRQEMIDVVNGRLAIDEFVARNGLSEATDEIKLIRQMQSEKESRQQLLAESVNGSAALKRRISEFDYYQTRMYERFLLGDKYTPDPEDYRAGVGMVADEIAGKLSQIERLGQKLAVKGAPFGRGEPTVAVDVADWLRTGDTALLEGLATSRQTRLIALRNTYQRYADLVDSVAQGKDGGLVLAQDAVKVADAAKDAIDYYLSKNDQAIQGANGIANLRRRVLDDVWRKLYGEITDPAYTSGRSTEVQTQLLAQQAFFRDAHDEGRDKYWWERSAPGRVQLGKRDKYFDRLRYGPLAGKFVTQETHDLLHPSPRSNSIARNIADAAFFKPQATMRLLKLIAPKTITRNYVTAYTGFAMASGDVALPGFHKHFAEAHKLIARAARGEEAATETMRQLAAVNAFRTSTSSIIQDIDRAVSKSPGGRMSAALQKVGNAYAYIDFPTKYAAYMARMESGMTPQQAAKHVQDMYQNRDRIPKIIGQIGQGGLADYFGYTYDSVRITANQIQHARAEAKRGNLAPAIGFLVGHGLQAALISAKATAAVGGVWAAIHRLLREEYFVEESKQLEPVVMAALRDFQPEYYENAAQVSWEERKGGERTVYYTILSGHTAWPVEDFVIGVGQRARQEGVGSIPRAAIGQVAERVGPGMYVDVLAKAMMGESFGSKYNSKGVWDSFQIPHDSDRGRIVLEAAGKYLADVYGGPVGQWASERYDYTNPRSSAYRERTRESGTYVNSITPKDIAVGKAALVRTYRITKSDMERLIKARVKDWSLAVISAKQSRNEPARLRSIESLTGIVNNARKVSGDWFSEREYVAILRDAGLNKDEAEAAVEGNVSSLEQYNPERTPTNLERVRNPKQSTGMSLDAGMDLSL